MKAGRLESLLLLKGDFASALYKGSARLGELGRGRELGRAHACDAEVALRVNVGAPCSPTRPATSERIGRRGGDASRGQEVFSAASRRGCGMGWAGADPERVCHSGSGRPCVGTHPDCSPRRAGPGQVGH